MEKYRTLAARKYYLLSCHRYFIFKGHKEYEESLVIIITNEGGSISFTFTNLITNEVIEFKNPKTGEYVVPITKGGKTKLVITASMAIGAYKIVKNCMFGAYSQTQFSQVIFKRFISNLSLCLERQKMENDADRLFLEIKEKILFLFDNNLLTENQVNYLLLKAREKLGLPVVK